MCYKPSRRNCPGRDRHGQLPSAPFCSGKLSWPIATPRRTFSLPAPALEAGHEGVDGGTDRAHRTPLVQRVYQLLLTKISRGDYQPDEKLPGEHELAGQFLVSPPHHPRGLAPPQG